VKDLSSFSSDYMTWHWRKSVWPLVLYQGHGGGSLPKVTTVPLPCTPEQEDQALIGLHHTE